MKIKKKIKKPNKLDAECRCQIDNGAILVGLAVPHFSSAVVEADFFTCSVPVGSSSF